MSRTTIERWGWDEPVERVVAALARGAVIAFPTESSYGLGVDPRDRVGVAAVYRLKERERGKPLPVVVDSAARLESLGIDSENELLRRVAPHWPAPLTAVLPVAADWPAAAGGGTLAVRVPAHPGLRALLAAVQMPWTATSANRAGEPPLLNAAEVAAWLAEAGADGLVVGDETLPGGPPSTVVSRDARGVLRVLREGAFPWPPPGDGRKSLH